MKATTEDISPWQASEFTEIKQKNRQPLLSLPKVGPVEEENDLRREISETTHSGITLNELRQSLQFIRNKSTQHTRYAQFGKDGSSPYKDSEGRDQFRPSHSLAVLKRSHPVVKPLKGNNFVMSNNRSTPFIKSRMQALLRNYEQGLAQSKYVKQKQSPSPPKTRLQKIEAKRTNIHFFYNQAAKEKANPEQRRARQCKNHILDTLLGRLQ